MNRKESVLKMFERLRSTRNSGERKKIEREIVNVCQPIINRLCQLHNKYQQPCEDIEDYCYKLSLGSHAGKGMPLLKGPILDEVWDEISFVFDDNGLDQVVSLDLPLLEENEIEEYEDMLKEMRIGDLEDMAADGVCNDTEAKELAQLKKEQEEKASIAAACK